MNESRSYRVINHRSGAVLQTCSASETTSTIADTVAFCEAMQAAGWAAAIYGEVEVFGVETGKKYRVSAREVV